MTQTPDERRAAVIGSLRSLIDLLETHPEIPAPSSIDAWIFLVDGGGSTQASRFAAVHDVAGILNVPVVADEDDYRRCESHIGMIHLYMAGKADRSPSAGKRVVTRDTDEALAPVDAAYGECRDERMRSVA